MCKGKRFALFGLSLAVAVILAPRAEAVTIFGLNPHFVQPPGGPTDVLRIETSPFSVSTIGTVAGEMLSGLDFRPGTGTLFASAGNGGAHPGSLFTVEASIVFDLDGTLYGSAGSGTGASSLIRIDPATGAGTLVGAYGPPNLLLDGIEIDPRTGIMYGGTGAAFDRTPGDIFTINKATGAATLIGSLANCTDFLCDTLPEGPAGLAFDPAGNLYGSLGGGDGRIISINLSNFTWAYLGDAAAGSVSGIAIIPEPNTLALVITGLVGLAAGARRGRRLRS
jgi:hypothetical protein